MLRCRRASEPVEIDWTERGDDLDVETVGFNFISFLLPFFFWGGGVAKGWL